MKYLINTTKQIQNYKNDTCCCLFGDVFEQGFEHNCKDPKFKIGDIMGISIYKNIFAKGYSPDWSEEVFVIEKVQTFAPEAYVIIDLKSDLIVGTFYEKESKNTSKTEFRVQKVIKKESNMSNVRQMEKLQKFLQQLERYGRYSIRITRYILESYEHSGGNVNVELDLSNYAAKVDLKGATGIDTSTFAQKLNLASWKTKVGNLECRYTQHCSC